MEQEKSTPTAMAFYNPEGIVPAFKHASAFAGEGGRIATLPDIIDARLATKPDDLPWRTYFTTRSAEYVGLSKAGNPVAIVAHGVGPMSTLDGILAAYRHEFGDKTHNNQGGQISQEEFLKLESGAYGDVQAIGLESTWEWRPYPFSGHAITFKGIEEEPLWQARLGVRWQEYVECHEGHARNWHLREAGIDPENKYKLPNHERYCDRRRAMHLRLGKEGSRPSILGMDGAHSYSTPESFEHRMQQAPETAIAHLLSVGGLINSHHEHHEYQHMPHERRESLVSEVGCHGWGDGVRLLGIRAGSDLKEMHPGLQWDYGELVKKALEKLFSPNPGGVKQLTNGFWHLVEKGGRWFADYPKRGESMDTCEPEFLVTKKEKVGEPKRFHTAIGGHEVFFRYGIKEVRQIAPLGANAYTMDSLRLEKKDGSHYHAADVTFYRVTIDTSQRLIRMADIYRDFDLMMSLI